MTADRVTLYDFQGGKAHFFSDHLIIIFQSPLFRVNDNDISIEIAEVDLSLLQNTTKGGLQLFQYCHRLNQS